MMILRRRMMGEESIPYQKIEYLKSDGTQYIDTQIIPNVNTEVSVTFAVHETNTYGYFGARKDPLRFCCTTFSAGSQFAFAMTNNVWPTYRTPVILEHFYNVSAKNGSYSIDGTNYSTGILDSFNIDVSFLLFGYYYNNFSVKSKISVKNVIIKENDSTILELIPVRIGTTGYMYDKVSKQLFGNTGTGDFILGPDVN